MWFLQEVWQVYVCSFFLSSNTNKYCGSQWLSMILSSLWLLRLTNIIGVSSLRRELPHPSIRIAWEGCANSVKVSWKITSLDRPQVRQSDSREKEGRSKTLKCSERLTKSRITKISNKQSFWSSQNLRPKRSIFSFSLALHFIATSAQKNRIENPSPWAQPSADTNRKVRDPWCSAPGVAVLNQNMSQWATQSKDMMDMYCVLWCIMV